MDSTKPAPEADGPVAAAARPGGRIPTRTWRFNVRLLAGTLILFAVAGPLLYVWRDYQIGRNASALGKRARDLHERKEWRSAAGAFHRYLQLRPDDAEAVLLRAESFDKTAVSRDERKRAASLYAEAVQRNEKSDDAKLRLAELLFEIGHYDEVLKYVDKLSDDAKAGLTASRLVAAATFRRMSSAGNIRPTDAVAAFESALQLHPGDIPLSIGFAELLRTNRDALPDAKRAAAIPSADAAIDRMIAVHENDPKARLARFRYRTTYGIPGADDDLEQARRLAPQDPDVLLASLVAAQSDRTQAKAYGDELLVAAPDDRRTYLALAAVHAQENDLAQATEVLRKGLRRIGKDDLELNRALLRTLLTVGDVTDARATIDRLEPVFRRIGPMLAAPDRRRIDEELKVADAQLLSLEGKPLAALPVLKRMAANVTDLSDAAESQAERERRWRLLAMAYARAGLRDLAAAACEELIALNPRSAEYRALAAAEWRASGDLQRAEENYKGAIAAEASLWEAWLGLAEVRMDQQLRRPPGEARDWSGVDAAFKRAQAGLGEVPAVMMLEATVALARADRETALSRLRNLLSKEGLPPAVLPRVAQLFELAGSRDEADSAIAAVRKSGTDPSLAAIAQADLLRRRGELSEAIRLLEKAADSAEKDKSAVLQRLVDLEIDGGSIRSARHRLRELRKQRTTDLWVYETAVDLAMMAGDLNDLSECDTELEGLEGPGGPLWRFVRVLRLLEEMRAGGKKIEDDARMRTVDRLVSEIDLLRPSWSQALLLRGRIAESSGRIAEATDDYERALRSGARNRTAFQWLIGTLYRQNRFADVASFISQAGPIAMVSGDLLSLAVPASLRAGRLDDAQRLARTAAELRPNDPLAQVWYAQTLALADRAAEAEVAFLEAKKRAPKDIRTWSGLVWFYSGARRQAEARKTLEELVATIEMPPYERELVLARGFDLIGDRSIAESHYLAARAAHRRDSKLLEEIGRFYYRFDYEKSREAYQAALEVDPKSDESRRAVAALWGLIGSEADLARAVGLLESDRLADRIDDRRLEATLLLLRGNPENYRKAADLMSASLAAQEKPSPVDRLLLARAYEELGRIDSAQEQLTTAVEGNAASAVLAAALEFLVRQNRTENADPWLARLEALEPNGTRAIDLRARILQRAGRADAIEPTVEAFVTRRLEAMKTDPQRLALRRFAVDLYTRTKCFDAAEKQLRAMVELSPPTYELLAVWLADRGRVADAIALCDGPSTGSEGLSRTSALVRVLTIATSRSMPVPDAGGMEMRLASIEKSSDTSVALLLELGVLRIMQGRDADAIALYERALAREPESIAVQNNIALALCEIPERHRQALEYIDRAVAAAPNSAELLDSKALVLIGVGRNSEAREILERLCQINRRSARYRLHLATALQALNERAEARRHIDRAAQDGLDAELLTPSERRAWQQIMTAEPNVSAR